MPEGVLIYALIFIVGICVGSFLNVCIYRIPQKQSIIRPRSMCPVCGGAIRFYDNLPIASFFLLKGRCRFCKTRIPLRYPLVELLTGLLAFSISVRHGITVEGLVLFAFAAALLTVAFIDMDHQIIPDAITLPGVGAGLAAAALLPGMRLIDSLLGMVSGGGILLAVALFYHSMTHKEGMGGGDIKLLAMIGAMTGWMGVLFTVFVASVLGAMVGILVMVKTQKGLKTALPFGPFLSLGALAYIHMGPELISWYFRFAR